MITLALAQMVYFFSLQTPRFTGGEDGIQSVPRGHLFGMLDLADDRALYWVVAAIFMAGLLLIYRIIHSPFGPGLQGDPGQRAARDLARLSRQPVQARRLRTLGHARRTWRARPRRSSSSSHR
jgi:hypothetical protein